MVGTHPYTQKHHIQIGDFDGPIELLLRLVEDRKMPINDISLALVTDDYITYVRSLSQMSYGMVTHFVSVAATLILIKARSLVTNLELTEEEEESIADLEQRLALYQIYARHGMLLKSSFTRGRRLYMRPFKMVRKVVFSPDSQITVSMLAEQIHDILHAPDAPTSLPTARVRIAVRLEDMIDSLTERMKTAIEYSFRDFVREGSGEAKSKEEQKVYTIVGFLAMLEMARHGLVAVVQEHHFHDMKIKRASSV